jgi:TolB-like protein
MASVIEGYNYDIFISYRQKDNKHDGWVTEFVNQLKGELESTFKEDISIYFDANPQDGLLETHDVDASLKEKLKCLIFIPIVSRTYCDPKSFAWEHEFITFVDQASQDQFGLKVKLPNGNVASRVLPVRIHDLDNEDIKLCESILGGVLRGIEFIYKEPGVNKPLAPGDDEKKNLNNTKYIIQINKIANAIKEIVTAIKKHNQPDGAVSKVVVNEKPESVKKIKPKIIIGSFLVLALLVLGYFFIPVLIKPSKPAVRSIAVLPFENMSDNEENVWFGDAMTDEITTQLYKIKELIVRSRTSVMQYKGTSKISPVIGQELKVNYLIEGSAQRIEDQVRIRVQLINAATDHQLWGETYESNWKDVSSLQSVIARQIADQLKAVLSPEEKELIEKNQTKNPEAYSLYLQGRFFWNKRTEEGLKKSVEYFEKSVAKDPDYALAYAGLADAYCILAWWGWFPRAEGYAKAKEFALQALNIDKNLAEAHTTLGDILCWSDWNWEEAMKELKLATELNPNYATAHQYYSEILDITGRNDEAREQINISLELDPFSPAINGTSALYYYNDRKFNESLDACRKTMEINPDYVGAYWTNFFTYIKIGQDLKAAETLQQLMLRDTLTIKVSVILKEIYSKYGINGILNWLIEWQKNNPAANLYLAKWYTILGRKEEALDRLDKALKERLSDIPGINGLPDEIPRIYNSPDYESLRTESRFLAIIRKLGLPEYSKN